MKARVHVTLKRGVLDPQGEAVRRALAAMGYGGVDGVRMGKVIDLDLAATDVAEARAQIDAMCRDLLANTVIENFEVEIA